jgi:hypothetical protein
MAKLKQKVSGCLTTIAGARQFCAIRSYLSTAAQHDLTFFDALVTLTEGQPWMSLARDQTTLGKLAPDQLRLGDVKYPGDQDVKPRMTN